MRILVKAPFANNTLSEWFSNVIRGPSFVFFAAALTVIPFVISVLAFPWFTVLLLAVAVDGEIADGEAKKRVAIKNYSSNVAQRRGNVSKDTRRTIVQEKQKRVVEGQMYHPHSDCISIRNHSCRCFLIYFSASSEMSRRSVFPLFLMLSHSLNSLISLDAP